MPVTNYVWDDENIDLEIDDAGVVQAEYTYEPQQYGNLISEYRGNETYEHHYDALGSTLQLTNSAGAVSDTFVYNAWGEEIARTGTTPTPFRWIGEVGYYYLIDSQRHYVRTRIYSGTTARWDSLDKVLFADDVNLYVYVHTNPVLHTDPSGAALPLVIGGLTALELAAAAMGLSLLTCSLTPACLRMAARITEQALREAAEAAKKTGRVCKKVLCKHRNPTWMACPPGASDSPDEATLAAAANPDPDKYRVELQECIPKGAATNCPGGAPGDRYYCKVVFWSKFNVVERRVYSVNCCKCCWTVSSGTSCLALHLAGGGGQNDLP